MKEVHVSGCLDSVRDFLSKAKHAMDSVIYEDGPGYIDDADLKSIAASATETAFLALITLTDALNLAALNKKIEATYEEAKKGQDGFNATTQDGQGDIWLMWHSHLHQFVAALEGVYNVTSKREVSRDLQSILRAAQYAITNTDCFSAVPANETEVHNRIEAVLRCVFTDLHRKPTIAKPIKNFTPDTGIPSLRTLIEYKFVSTKDDAGRIADEILADTRGYVSNDWDHFVYLIYETARVKPESEWRSLLRACQTAESTAVIVMCGEKPIAKSKPKSKKAA